MKFIMQIIAIVLVAYVLEIFLPWYSVAFVAFVFGYLLKSKVNFLAGFVAVALLWFIKIRMIDSASPSDLAARVALLFPVKQESLLILVTVMIGGLVGGFAALTGALLKPSKRRIYY